MRAATRIVGTGSSSQGGKGSLTSWCRYSKSLYNLREMVICKPCNHFELLAKYLETKNQDQIFLLSQTVRCLSSGESWVFLLWLQAGLWLCWGKAGRSRDDEQSCPAPRLSFQPNKINTQNSLFPEFSLQNWVMAINWPRESGIASSYCIEISILR